MAFTLLTDNPVAKDSPDHLHPKGSKNVAGGPNYTWVGGYNPYADEVLEYCRSLGIMQPKVLDLGAASGHLVHDFLKRGADAVGLEGSTWPLEHERQYWLEHYNSRLFTCDISKPFTVCDEQGKPVTFDIINAWEVCEHLPPDELSVFADNIYRHLSPDTGVFVISVSPWFEPHDNSAPVDEQINLHLSKDLNRKSDWEAVFHNFDFVGPVGDKHNSAYHYKFKHRYRGRARGPEGDRHTFWSTLTRKKTSNGV